MNLWRVFEGVQFLIDAFGLVCNHGSCVCHSLIIDEWTHFFDDEVEETLGREFSDLLCQFFVEVGPNVVDNQQLLIARDVNDERNYPSLLGRVDEFSFQMVGLNGRQIRPTTS